MKKGNKLRENLELLIDSDDLWGNLEEYFEMFGKHTV